MQQSSQVTRADEANVDELVARCEIVGGLLAASPLLSVSYIRVIRLNYMLFDLSCSLFLLGVVLEEIVGHEFDRVLRTLLRALSQCLQQYGHHSLVEVGANWQVLNVIRVTVV